MDQKTMSPTTEKQVLESFLEESKKREGAKYKIDLLLGRDFSLRKPSTGVISWWESGRALHGDGDTKLYLCPGCETMIHSTAQGHDSAVCRKCGKVWPSGDLVGEMLYRLETQKWSEVLLKWFLKLEMQADIRIIYPPDDIRSMAAREQDRQMGGEILERGRERRATRVYPLRNIIKDTSAGADLQGRFLAFLRA